MPTRLRSALHGFISHATLLCAALVAGCGGGGSGGGGSALTLSLSPSSISASIYSGSNYTFNVTATVQGTVSGPVYVIIVDKAGVLQPSVSIQPQAGGSYIATLTTQSSLALGDHSGTFQVLLCGDSGCAQQYGGASLPYDFKVIPYPVPTLGSFTPTSVIAGGQGLTLSVNGSNFVSATTLMWNGSSRPTQYISSTQLSATISASDVANGGVVQVSVSNPSPGGGPSNSEAFTVYNPQPTLRAINDDTSAVGCAAFTLYVIGSSFVPSSSVMWNGVARTTTMVSSTLLTAQITVADVATAGQANVTVSNPAPGGGATTAQSFTINSPGAPTTDSVAFQINAAHSGSATTSCPLSLPATSAWTASIPGGPSVPLIGSGGVYVTAQPFSNRYTLYGFDQSSGNALWPPVTISQGGGGGSAAYDAGRVFVPGTLAVLGYDAITGAQEWITYVGQGPTSGLSAANGSVFVAGLGNVGGGGDIFALNEASGTLQWTGDAGGTYYSIPAATADGVYASFDCTTDLNPATGAQIWRTGNCGTEPAITFGQTPVVAAGLVFAPDQTTNYNGNILSATSGANTGTYTADTLPAVTAQWHFYLQSSVLVAQDSSGSPLWTFSGDGYLVTSPIIVNKTVFIGSGLGNVYGLDAATGQQLWQANVGAQILSGVSPVVTQTASLAAGDGLLVVPTSATITAYVISNLH